MSSYSVRIVGDPVLRATAAPVETIDDALVNLVDDMFTTMYAAPGIGLAAPQVGVQQRFFVYDMGEGLGEPSVLINPSIVEGDGEWWYEEGCLSIPGVYFEICRPKRIHLCGLDLDGNEINLEADELEARLFQHEIDHLDGVLMLDHLDEDQRKEAKRHVRELQMKKIEGDKPTTPFRFFRS